MGGDEVTVLTAVLFESGKRFLAFKSKLLEYGVDCVILDFSREDWINFDYKNIDIVVYFPSFKYTSNHPLALQEVHDNLMHIHYRNPEVTMFPDPRVIRY